MSREKQIEEIAEQIKYMTGSYTSDAEDCATVLYEQMNYRKQSEGEWIANRHISVSKRNRTIHYETYKCSVCGTWNGRHKTNFCPNCGARMLKGENNGIDD